MDNPHDYLITSPSRPRRPTDPDSSASWVMLNQGGFVKLGNERILLKLDSRISCDLSVPQELKARCTPFQCKSDKGTLFLTNKRVSLPNHAWQSLYHNLLSHMLTRIIRLYISPPSPHKSQNLNPSAPRFSSSRTLVHHRPCGGAGYGSRIVSPSLEETFRLTCQE